jgi:hypothetical protein
MDTIAILAILILAFLVGLAISVPSIIKIIRILRTPTTWISALPSEGAVEVMGKVGDKTILSPITRTACAAYMLEVQQYKRSRNSSGWRTISKTRSKQPFEIDDETGTLLIDPSNAELMVSGEGFDDSLNAEQKAALEGLGIKTTGFLGSEKKLRVIEHLVTPQQEIYAIGKIQPGLGKKTIAGEGSVPLIISDRSERDVLITLYKRVGLYMLISVAVGVTIILVFTLQ